MKIIRNLKLRLKAFILSGMRGGNSMIRTGGGSKRKYVENDPINGYAGWVYAALSKRAKRVGAVQIHLYEMNRGGDVNEIYDDNLLALLYRANPRQSKYQFFYTLEMFLGIWGSAPVYYDRIGGPGSQIINLWPLRPDFIKPICNADGEITGYTYRVQQQTLNISPEDIIFINEPNPENILLGYSPLMAAALEVDTDVAAAIWNRALLENATESGIILSTDNTLSDDAFNRIKTLWNERQAGPMNAGKTAILENGLKPMSLGKSPKDMQLSDMRRFNRGAIVAILGVPEPLLTSENSNLANVEGSERIFAKDTIDPQCRLIIDTLNEFLVPLFGESKYLTYDSQLPEDTEKKVNQANIAEGKWMTTNEARAMFDLPPMIGGDAIWKPLGVAPQIEGFEDGTVKRIDGYDVKKENGKLFLKLEAQQGYFDDKKTIAIKQGILNRGKGRRMQKQIVDGAFEKLYAKLSQLKFSVKTEGNVIRLSQKKKSKARKVSEDDMDPRLKNDRKEFLKALPRAQVGYHKQLKAFFRKQEKEVLANLEDAGVPKGMKASLTSWLNAVLFDDKKNNKIILDISGEQWKTQITAGAAATARLLGVSPSDVMASPQTIKYLKERSATMIDVNTTTQDAIRKTLTEGVDNLESMGQLSKRVSDVYDQAEGFRSETIARSETVSAQNFGRNEEMVQQGAERKVWLCIFSNSRDAHMDADHQVVTVDSSFSVGGEDLDFPGDPNGSPENTINCQCSVSPTLDPLT